MLGWVNNYFKNTLGLQPCKQVDILSSNFPVKKLKCSYQNCNFYIFCTSAIIFPHPFDKAIPREGPAPDHNAKIGKRTKSILLTQMLPLTRLLSPSAPFIWLSADFQVIYCEN